MSVAAGRGGPLAHAVLGDSGPWIVFLHGLFGQGKNWTTVAKALADRAQIVLVDLPNHGNSPWTEQFSYPGMAADVAELLVSVSGSEPVVLVGHSMGGKVAMLVALAHPDAVAKLCVVDVSPVVSSTVAGFAGYVAGMRGLDLAGLADRAAADAGLTFAVPDRGVRSFLLQSLRRSGGPTVPAGAGSSTSSYSGITSVRSGTGPTPGTRPIPGRCSGSPAPTPTMSAPSSRPRCASCFRRPDRSG